MELRKSQAERRNKNDSSSADESRDSKPHTPVSPTKANPARLSGDFSLKYEQAFKQQSSSTPSSTTSSCDSSNTTQTSPMSILKPARAAKPNTTSSIPSPHGSPIAGSGTPPKSASSSNVSSISTSHGGSTQVGKVPSDMLAATSKELTDIQNELKNWRKSSVTREEYDDLIRKVIIITFSLHLQPAVFSLGCSYVSLPRRKQIIDQPSHHIQGLILHFLFVCCSPLDILLTLRSIFLSFLSLYLFIFVSLSLFSQVEELKDNIDKGKDAYGSVVRELINEVAEVRKNVANLEIEVDRLRKLSTTV